MREANFLHLSLEPRDNLEFRDIIADCATTERLSGLMPQFRIWGIASLANSWTAARGAVESV